MFSRESFATNYSPKTKPVSFKHEPIDFGPVPQRIDDLPGGRVYRVPNGKLYPSVTNVLGVLPSKGLDEWAAAVGEEQAQLAADRGVHRGSQVHESLELYINNQSVPAFQSPKVRDSFDAMATTIGAHTGTVYGQEVRTYSDTMEIAGTFDLCAQWDGIPSIIDFKTAADSRSVVEHFDTFLKYSLQLYYYRCMVYERTGRDFKQLRIVMAADHENKPAAVHGPVLPDRVLAAGIRFIRDKYREQYGI